MHIYSVSVYPNYVQLLYINKHLYPCLYPMSSRSTTTVNNLHLNIRDTEHLSLVHMHMASLLYVCIH